MIILYILLAIVVLLFMVLIHELGHYLVGRWLGFRITEFSIGFGKVLWQKINKRGEKISFRLVPLGGFCSFYGEDGEGQNEKGEIVSKKNDPDVFTNQKPWKRILVFLAGVTFNFISAIIFSFILLVSFGYGNAYEVRDVNPYFVASAGEGNQIALIEKGDKILEVDGVRIDHIWEKTIDKLTSPTEGNIYQLTVQKGDTGEIVSINVVMQTNYDAVYNEETNTYEIRQDEKTNENIMFTGIGVNLSPISIPLSFLEALSYCFMFTIGLVWMVLKSLWLIITFQIPLSALGGTATAVGVMAENMAQSMSSIFVYLPLLAANLGAFNALPIPGLDGSHTVFTTVEWVRGKPINQNVEGWIHFIGMICLFAFVILLDLIHFLG